MSTACYDRRPDPPRDPIQIAGDLARRGDKLSIEGANCIKRLTDSERQAFVLKSVVRELLQDQNLPHGWYTRLTILLGTDCRKLNQDGLPQDGTTFEHFFHPLRLGRD